MGRVTRIDSHAFLYISQYFCLIIFGGVKDRYFTTMDKISIVIKTLIIEKHFWMGHNLVNGFYVNLVCDMHNTDST